MRCAYDKLTPYRRRGLRPSLHFYNHTNCSYISRPAHPIIFGSIYSQAVDILSVLPFSFYRKVPLYENVLIAANTIVLRSS